MAVFVCDNRALQGVPLKMWWLLVLALALSPLAWLAPSRRQRGAMEMRLQARRMGLGMQLAQQDWPHWMLRPPPSSCAQYYRMRPVSGRPQWVYWQSEPGLWLNQWREPCLDQVLLQQLQRLPSDVFKVEAGPRVVALFWGERGGSDALVAIDQALRDWL